MNSGALFLMSQGAAKATPAAKIKIAAHAAA